jgi:hypothetical protein
MALQIKRGTNAFRLTQTLLQGEPFFVTDAVSLGITPFWIGNGTTLGGIATMNANNFDELLDINVINPVANNVLQYNADGTWRNSANLTVTGTASVAGALTASGAVTVAGVINSNGGVSGGAATHSTGTFTGNVSAVNVTASGDISVNGGDITSTSATANLFNDFNHTSINIGNAATGTVFLGNSGNTTSVKGALTVGGNLTVNGTTTSVNSTIVNIKDEMIVLNYGETGTGVTPNTRRAGVQVARGTSASVSIQYNEQTDQWELTNDGTNFSPIALGSGYSSTTDISAKSVSTTDYLKVLNTGTTNYISQTTAQHTAKWTLDDAPDTYKLSLDNVDKITVGASATNIVNPTTITGDTTITGNATVSGSLTAGSLSLSGDPTFSGTVRTGNNIIMNSSVTGAPSANATITVERGTSTDATFAWNETYDWWNASNSLYVNDSIIAGNSLAANGERITLNNDGGALNGAEGLYITRPANAYGGQATAPASIIWNEASSEWRVYSPPASGSPYTWTVIGKTELNDLTDVAISSVAKGQLLSYTGSQWVNTNTLSADSTANRLNLEINSSTAGVTNSMVVRKNFGATNYANGDGTGIRFEVGSTSQGITNFAGLNATYSSTLPSVNFSTSIDNGVTFTDVVNFTSELANLPGNVRINGNKVYDSTNAVALEYVRTGSGSSAYNTAKFNTGANNYGLGANFLNLDSIAEHNTSSLTTTATTTTVMDSWPLAGWRSAKYLIQISNGSNHQMWEGMMIHDGTSIKITAYGDLRTGSANLATVTAGINTTTSRAELRVTPVNATQTKFKATKTLIAV